MKRILSFLIFLFLITTTQAQLRDVWSYDSDTYQRIRNMYPNYKMKYPYHGVWILETTREVKYKPQPGDWRSRKIILVDSLGNNIMGGDSFTAIMCKSADEDNPELYPFFEAFVNDQRFCISMDGKYLTGPVKVGWTYKRVDKKEGTKYYADYPDTKVIEYRPGEGFVVNHTDRYGVKKYTKIKHSCTINENGIMDWNVKREPLDVTASLKKLYTYVKYIPATHTFLCSNGAAHDYNGNMLLPPAKNGEYNQSKYVRGYFIVKNRNNKCGVYKIGGEELIPIEYIDIKIKWENGALYFLCKTTGKNDWGEDYNAAVYDTEGELLIPPYYGTISYSVKDGFSSYFGGRHFIYLDKDNKLDREKSHAIDYTIPEEYFARLKVIEEKRLEEQRLAAARLEAQLQRQVALQQMAATISKLGTEVGNAINQYNGATAKSAASTYKAPSTDNSSSANTTELQRCKRNYSEWESNAKHWIKIFTEEQAWLKAHSGSNKWDPVEVASHHRRRSDARTRLKNALQMLQHYRSSASKAGGSIPKSATESSVEACLN